MKHTSIILSTVFGFFLLFHFGFLVFLLALAFWLACGYANHSGLKAVENDFDDGSAYLPVVCFSYAGGPVATIIHSCFWAAQESKTFFPAFRAGWKMVGDNRFFKLHFPVELKHDAPVAPVTEDQRPG